MIEWHTLPGLAPYETTVAAMEVRVAAIHAGTACEAVWLLEHPPLYTAGTSAKAQDLHSNALPVHRTGRGGQYTYHGPGQRLAYVMLDLGKRGGDIRRFVWQLEEAVIRTLAALGVAGERRAGRIGIWVGRDGREDKIAAIGLRVRHGVTYHGLSLNITPDLSHYAGITPCGLSGFGVTSLQSLGKTASMQEIDQTLQTNFETVFSVA